MSVRRWIEAWEHAWNTLDPEALDGVYAERCSFRTHPFREPEDPLEYARRVLAEEGDVDAQFGEPFVQGDRACVEWWATYTEGGREVTIAGCSVLRFDGDGRCAEQRDYWAETTGRRAPFVNWGR